MENNEKPRTPRQNRSLHKLMSELSDELNDHGMTMMKVLSQSAEILWTPEMAKQLLLRPFIKAMFNKTSTTQLSTKELSEACEALLNHIAKSTGVALNFPSIESQEMEQKSERVRKCYEQRSMSNIG